MWNETCLVVILIFICVLGIYVLRCCAKIKGGHRVVPITNLFELPQKIEYVDDVTGKPEYHDTKLDRYNPPSSNEQIRTVARYGSTGDYGRLIQLVGKFYRGPTWEITRLLNRKDSEIYDELRRKFPRDNIDPSKRDYHHAYCIARDIKRFIDSPKTLLDIGCNTGGIAVQLGKLLNIKTVSGVDVIPTSHPDINYTQIEPNKPLPFANDSQDLVTANMTLHHVQDIKQLVKEIYRVLKPGGLVFIKEHDCWSANDAMLIDIEHLLYDRVGGDQGDYQLYHYTNYYGWDKIFGGMEYVGADYFYLNLKNEMSATRAYWCIYKKSKKIKAGVPVNSNRVYLSHAPPGGSIGASIA